MQPDGLGDLVADGVDRVQAGQRFLEDHRDLVAADLAHLVFGELHQVDDRPVGLAKQDLATFDPATGAELDQTHDRQRGDRLAGP